MPLVVRVGDPNDAGGIVVFGALSVTVNGRAAAYVGSPVTPHPCCGAIGCPPIHCAAVVAIGSLSVTVEGKPLAYVGAPDTCGHVRALGSFDVQVGS